MTMVGYLQQEFGRGGSVATELLEAELAEGQRQAAAKRAEAEALKKAQRTLDGRDK